MSRTARLAVLLSLVALGVELAAQAGGTADRPAPDRVRGHLLTFQDNGAWSWFEDERAVVDPVAGRILVGSCADGAGAGGAGRDGDIDVAWLDLRRGRIASFALHERLQGDDHDSPALLVLPDGRYLAMYGMHGGRGEAPLLSRWRRTVRPGDPTAWTPERTFRHARSMSYSNLIWLPAPAGVDGPGVVWNFVRATNFDPCVMTSTDLGETFTGTGKLLTEGGNADRPYVKYASDGASRVHLITTERHPRDFDNSIYHGYVEGGVLHDSSGAVVDADVRDADGQPPARLTPVFVSGTAIGGTVLRRAWTVDLAADASGALRALFIARAEDRDTDHRLLLGRFDGAHWTVTPVCAMGGHLYPSENDYTGLAALHPDDPDRLFVSTDVDPRDGTSLARHEIFDGRTRDGGGTWSWQPVTRDSTVDNLRPIVPRWAPDRTALLWFRGTYATYGEFDTAVVGIVDAPELRCGPVTYVDATAANTTLVGGERAPASGPAPGPGPADGRWHARSGVGNGDRVWTADATGTEDVPMLCTRIERPAGVYDLFVYFWSNPAEDWAIRAGLDRDALRTFTRRSSATADPADFTAPVTCVGATVALYAAWLGRVELGDAGDLGVFVDDPAGAQPGTGRTWFDGIGVAPARPGG
ncbi:MAG: BNR-4 repeat-containing protein [Planctomycetes bacterium]|nr:BNR-4 repeat-containing protein [Planctomycetota bacterium]